MIMIKCFNVNDICQRGSLLNALTKSLLYTIDRVFYTKIDVMVFNCINEAFEHSILSNAFN